MTKRLKDVRGIWSLNFLFQGKRKIEI